LTFEIIMCLTLNSATECAGSRFQVVVEVCGVASVPMVVFPFYRIRCVRTIIVATNIIDKIVL
jgi:hypothetical protein